MKKGVLLLVMALLGLLAACGQSPEDAAAMGALDYRNGLPLVTENEALLEPLSGFNPYHVKRGSAAAVAQAYGVGLVGYTPIPDEIVVDGGWVFPKLSRLCMLVPCDRDGNPIPDPRLGLTIGWDFTGIYLTPTLREQAKTYGFDAYDLSSVDASGLIKLTAKTGTKVAVVGSGVGLIDPDSWPNHFCNQPNPPRICWFMNTLEDQLVTGFGPEDLDIHGVGLVITNYGDLTNISEASELVLAHGEGVEPVISTAQVALPESVDQKAAISLAEQLFSAEGQYSLAKGGLLPVNKSVLSDVAGGLAKHVYTAYEHGMADDGRPQPVPF